MYSERILEEFYNPANCGTIKGANAVGKVKNGTCGDIIKIFAVIEKDTVKEANFLAYGSVATIASASVATNLIIGKTLDEINSITSFNIKAELGDVPENKSFSLLMAEDAIHSLLDYYFKKTKGGVPEEFKSARTSNILNSDEAWKESDIDDEDIDEELEAEVVEAEKVEPKKAKKAVKPAKAEKVAKEEKAEKPAKTGKKKTVKKTVEVYTTKNNNDLEEMKLFDSFDEITSSLGDALKKLNEANEAQDDE